MFLEHESDCVIQEPPEPLPLGVTRPSAGVPFCPAHCVLSFMSSLNVVSLGRPPLTEGPARGCSPPSQVRGVTARGRAPCHVPLPLLLRSPWAPGAHAFARVPGARWGRPVGHVHSSALPHTMASARGLSREQGRGSGGLGPEVRGGSGLDVAPEPLRHGPFAPSLGLSPSGCGTERGIRAEGGKWPEGQRAGVDTREWTQPMPP